MQEHCLDEMYVEVRKKFWEVTLQALVDSALHTRSIHDRLQLNQKYAYIKDEFNQCVTPAVLLVSSVSTSFLSFSRVYKRCEETR